MRPVATATPGLAARLTVPGRRRENYCVDVRLLITIFAAVLLALAWHGLTDAAHAQGGRTQLVQRSAWTFSQASQKLGRKWRCRGR